VRLDVADAGSVEKGALEILDRVGAPDGVVHNAGMAGVGATEEMPQDEFERMHSTNFHGPVRLTRELLPSMRAAGRGRIVLISSMGAVRGMPGIGAYSAAKAALERWGESLAIEVAPFGLGVSVLVAGTFRTDILELTRNWADPDGPYGAMQVPLERNGRRFVRFAADPARFGPAVERALGSTRPFSRRGVGIDARMMLVGARLLPGGTIPAIAGRALRLPRPDSLRTDARRHAPIAPPEERRPIG
jgi:NAD(P)-dependent dehydrogenase (short-subunit alcohol dehydrogenase family)